MIRHYTEVYDINTKLNAMTMLGIHTPQASALKKMFKGHFINYKKYKIIGCDIKVACASTLPLNAEQVGLESGEVDPRDVMNPMLFKACTGDNLNALLNQIYNKNEEETDNLHSAIGSVAEHINENVPSMRAYYQMLSDPTWRKAHPQAGMTVRNLKPYVHKVVTTQPFKFTGFSDSTQFPYIAGGTYPAGDSYGFGSPSGKEMTNTTNSTGEFAATNASVFVSNGIAPMPWLDTAIPQTVTTLGAVVGDSAALTTKQANWFINSVPRVYCGCLIMPPGVSTKFYMRMLIDWKIAFKDWRPAYEIGNIGTMQIVDTENGMGPSAEATTNWTTYYNMYHDSETKNRMEDEQSSFTSNGAESEMVYAS